MSPENRARVDALCREISALGSALDAMHQELLLLRNEMRGSLDDRTHTRATGGRMNDMILMVVAEMRCAELLCALQSAVNGDSHWRQKAAWLLADIEALRLPAPAFEKLREIDARKRAMEQMEDAVDA